MEDDKSVKLTAHIKAAGCAAKISASQLHEIVRALPEFASLEMLTTIGSFEDAAVYKLSDELALVSTIDFFPPVVDDPFLFGQVAAANALSDVYAMGAMPRFALAVLCFPICDYPLAVAQRIVAGAAKVLKDSGTVLAGGHSIQAAEPIFGLAVTGFVHPQKMLTNGGGKAGDALVITKRIGTGVLLLANKGEQLSDSTRTQLFEALTQLNEKAVSIGKQYNLHACTDVTGFGLLGHVHEMGKAAGLAVHLQANDVPLLDQARAFADQGFVPAAAYSNRESYKQFAYINDGVELVLTDLLFDPQTSGGLLFALPEEQAGELVADLHAAGLNGAIIGHLKDGLPGAVEVV